MAEGRSEEQPRSGEQSRRERVRMQAVYLGIKPEATQSNATVQRFLGVVEGVEQLHQNVSEAAHDNVDRPPLLKRYLCLQGLLDVELSILLNGLNQESWDRPALMASLRRPADYLELAIGEAPVQPRIDLPPPLASGIWHFKYPRSAKGALPRPPRLGGRDEAWWDSLPTLEQRRTPEYVSRLQTEAERVGFIPAMVDADPALQSQLTSLVDARALVAETEETESLSQATGLAPSAQERLKHVNHINRAVVRLLEDQVRPAGAADSKRAIANDLGQAVEPYGIMVRPRLG